MDYKELSSEEEADKFQKEYYEEYCEQLSRRRKVMTEYKYRNNDELGNRRLFGG